MRPQQRKSRGRGLVTGCILPILGLVGFIALCYVFCFVLFQLGSPGAQGGTTGALLPFLV